MNKVLKQTIDHAPISKGKREVLLTLRDLRVLREGLLTTEAF
jgi:hypothetical protein